MATLYPILHNMLPLVIVTLVVWAVVHARKQPLWAEAYRRLAHNPLALIALGIICLYGVIAVLDSLQWSDTRSGTEDRAGSPVCPGAAGADVFRAFCHDDNLGNRSYMPAGMASARHGW